MLIARIAPWRPLLLAPFLAVAAIAIPVTALAQEVRTRPGRPVPIGLHAQWSPNCAPGAIPTLVSPAAANGTISVRRGSRRISARTIGFGSAGVCEGRTVPAALVIYTPRRGFTGTDTATYLMQFDRTVRRLTVRVTVR
jgi:hypothetical protein